MSATGSPRPERAAWEPVRSSQAPGLTDLKLQGRRIPASRTSSAAWVAS